VDGGFFVLLGLGVLLVLGLLTAFGLLQQMLRQQGRLMLRIEALETALAVGPAAVPESPAGLDVGTPVPPFRLPDAVGRMVGPKDFPGKRLLLVHWSPQCGYCEQIAPDLAALHPELKRRNTELLLLTNGDVEMNRRLAEHHGLTCPILHLEGSGPLEFFAGLGTPVAYLLDEQGRIAERLAVGAVEVPALARRIGEPKRLGSERSLHESRLERDGLPMGSPAPPFTLADLDGETVSLGDYRGHPLLLVFSDPSCGPCNTLAPELARFQRRHGAALPVVMVSRGDVDANRAKAEEHGLEFPILIQPGWRVSKEYGIFATPVAFLIDAEGTIAREVARGATEILQLARASVTASSEVAAPV
jgi:peroxiredoxin